MSRPDTKTEGGEVLREPAQVQVPEEWELSEAGLGSRKVRACNVGSHAALTLRRCLEKFI